MHLDLIPLNLDSILEAFALGLSLAECGAELWALVLDLLLLMEESLRERPHLLPLLDRVRELRLNMLPLWRLLVRQRSHLRALWGQKCYQRVQRRLSCCSCLLLLDLGYLWRTTQNLLLILLQLLYRWQIAGGLLFYEGRLLQRIIIARVLRKQISIGIALWSLLMIIVVSLAAWSTVLSFESSSPFFSLFWIGHHNKFLLYCTTTKTIIVIKALNWC